MAKADIERLVSIANEHLGLKVATTQQEIFSSGYIRFDVRGAVRALLAAMREPTLAQRHVCRFEFAEVDWPAMLDELLSE